VWLSLIPERGGRDIIPWAADTARLPPARPWIVASGRCSKRIAIPGYASVQHRAAAGTVHARRSRHDHLRHSQMGRGKHAVLSLRIARFKPRSETSLRCRFPAMVEIHHRRPGRFDFPFAPLSDARTSHADTRHRTVQLPPRPLKIVCVRDARLLRRNCACRYAASSGVGRRNPPW